MKTSLKVMTISLFLLGAGLLSGCSTASHARKDPTFPVTPGHRYTVYVGDRQFVVDSVRFEGDWVVLEGGYPALKAMWIPREQVSVIQEPK
jgi:predicted small secreted protein